MTYHYFGGKPLIDFEAAVEILLSACPMVSSVEVVPIDACVRRVLAESLAAKEDVPAFNRSTMDGFAVRSEDIRRACPDEPVVLSVRGSIAAGADPSAPVLTPGTAVQIATGAPLPTGADVVVPFEDVEREDQKIIVRKSLPSFKNVTLRGADIRAGTVAVKRGDYLSPARVAVAAGLGYDRLTVFCKPRVVLLSSGDEVQRPGRSLKPGQVYDMNSFALSALVSDHGGQPLLMEAVPDAEDDLNQALTRALSQGDFVVLSAGSSVGERDLMPRILRRRGRILFHGVAIRPGRPVLSAIVDGRLVLNLPGFPASCLMVAYLFLVPALRKAAHLPQWKPRTKTAVLGEPITSPPGLRHFLPVRMEKGIARSVFKESGTITSLSEADGYIDIDPSIVQLPEGEQVTVHLFDDGAENVS